MALALRCSPCPNFIAFLSSACSHCPLFSLLTTPNLQANPSPLLSRSAADEVIPSRTKRVYKPTPSASSTCHNPDVNELMIRLTFQRPTPRIPTPKRAPAPGFRVTVVYHTPLDIIRIVWARPLPVKFLERLSSISQAFVAVETDAEPVVWWVAALSARVGLHGKGEKKKGEGEVGFHVVMGLTENWDGDDGVLAREKSPG